MSIPFTWLLGAAREYIQYRSFLWDSVVVGGPAVFLMPGFFVDIPNVSEGRSMPGVLQRVNPQASRTTLGCTRACRFCGVSKIEPEFQELADWPNLPVLCDNNILASSQKHFDKVCDRLEKYGWCDFNQGIDARLLTSYHAERLKRIGSSIIRLALDFPSMRDQWELSFHVLRSAGITKRQIRSYCLVGYCDDPDMAWEQCRFVEGFGIKALPMWYHELDALAPNQVTAKQESQGWSDYERRKIMQWFYKHKKAVRRTSCAQPRTAFNR